MGPVRRTGVSEHRRCGRDGIQVSCDDTTNHLCLSESFLFSPATPLLSPWPPFSKIYAMAAPGFVRGLQRHVNSLTEQVHEQEEQIAEVRFRSPGRPAELDLLAMFSNTHTHAVT